MNGVPLLISIKQPVFVGLQKSSAFAVRWQPDYKRYMTLRQALCRQPIPAAPRIPSWTSPCRICGLPSGAGIGVRLRTSVFPCQYHSTNTPTYLNFNTTLTRRTSGRNLGAFKQNNAFSAQLISRSYYMQYLVRISLAMNAAKDMHRNQSPTPQKYAHYPNQLAALMTS
jgi:hypothetical protein